MYVCTLLSCWSRQLPITTYPRPRQKAQPTCPALAIVGPVLKRKGDKSHAPQSVRPGPHADSRNPVHLVHPVQQTLRRAWKAWQPRPSTRFSHDRRSAWISVPGSLALRVKSDTCFPYDAKRSPRLSPPPDKSKPCDIGKTALLLTNSCPYESPCPIPLSASPTDRAPTPSPIIPLPQDSLACPTP